MMAVHLLSERITGLSQGFAKLTKSDSSEACDQKADEACDLHSGRQEMVEVELMW